MGPALCARPGRGAGDVQGAAGDPVRQEALAGGEMVATRVDFLTGYQDAAYAARSTRPSSTRCKRPKSPLGGGTQAERGRGPLPVQADGLQGRVRGGTPAHRPGLHGRRSPPCSRATTSWCTTWRRRSRRRRTRRAKLVKQPFGPWMRSAFGLLAKMKGLRGGSLDIFGRSDERKTGARADQRVPRLHRRAAEDAERRQPARWRPRSRASRKTSAAMAT